MNIENFKCIAHRGLFDREKIPENSMLAFEKAIEKGYAIELDVNMTKDGYIVVFHDNSLKRMTGIKNYIATMTLSEIKKLKLLGTENRIPTFEDVLLQVSGRVPLLIEVKINNRYKELMEKLINLLEKYNGNYSIQSFDPRIVYFLKKNAPQISRGQISSKNIREVKSRVLKILLGKMIFNVITKPNFISYQYLSINSKFYLKQKNKGRDVIAWTLKNKEDYEKIKDFCDMVVFENENTIK